MLWLTMVGMASKKIFSRYDPKKIRKRRSYEEWEWLINTYLKGDIAEVFTTLHHFFDRRKLYTYRRTAIWSEESCNQALKDKGLPHNRELFDWIKKHRRSNRGFNR